MDKRSSIIQKHRNAVNADEEYEYIKTYFKGDILPNGKIIGDKHTYIQIKHKFCGRVYETSATGFINNNNRCNKCCGSYEKSIAYYIENKLGLKLEDVWDFEKNTVNPGVISRGNNNHKIWIKCKDTDYHGSYETTCDKFSKGSKCSYCYSRKIHPLDSFGYHHFDKVLSWHPDNGISPFRVALNSNKKYKFVCENCSNVFYKTLNKINGRGDWCPECSMSKGEKKIVEWLRYNNIKYEYEKTYNGLVGLGGGLLSYDFYLPDYNLLIEYQGKQHSEGLGSMYAGEFKRQQEHDRRKRKYAKMNNIDLLEVWHIDFNNIETILETSIK